MGKPMIVRTDPRGRVSLAKLGAVPGSCYLAATVGNNGQILLTPAVVLPRGDYARLVGQPGAPSTDTPTEPSTETGAS